MIGGDGGCADTYCLGDTERVRQREWMTPLKRRSLFPEVNVVIFLHYYAQVQNVINNCIRNLLATSSEIDVVDFTKVENVDIEAILWLRQRIVKPLSPRLIV
jgi:hypothetical protein